MQKALRNSHIRHNYVHTFRIVVLANAIEMLAGIHITIMTNLSMFCDGPSYSTVPMVTGNSLLTCSQIIGVVKILS